MAAIFAGGRVPVEPQALLDRLDEGGEAVLVRQALINGDLRLAVLGELRQTWATF